MSLNNFDYTLNMETIFQNELSKLKSYYCREDFELALSNVDKAPTDSKKFRMRDMKQMCEARGIDVNEIVADRNILRQIPTREQMQEELLESFYNMYKNAPDTSSYMERIVCRLAPEYSGDTVRTAILKKFVIGSGVNFKRFNIKGIFSWAKEHFSEEENVLFDTLNEQGQNELVVSKLNDSIFAQDTIKLTNTDILILIADRIEKYIIEPSISFDGIVLKDSTKNMIVDLLSDFGILGENQSDTDLIYLLVSAVKSGVILVESLNDKYRMIDALEEDFINQLKAIKRVSKTGKWGSVADLYKQAKKDAVKAKKNVEKKNSIDFELLNLCNDLADGNFRVNGKTKISLYYFAFMFGMTISVKGEKYDPETDIVKNLFQDFYNDNLLRLLSGAYADVKLSVAVENEPTGEGINYKNFVEAIYIYFLCHKDLVLTPGERIDKAEETIEKCIKLSKRTENAGNMQDSVYTKDYRDNQLRNLLNKRIEEIPEYVLANYLVVEQNNIGSARIMVASEEKTASDCVDEIMKNLDETYNDPGAFSIVQRNDMTSVIKDDIAFRTDYSFDWKIKELLITKYSNDEKFIKIVSELDSRVNIHNIRFNKIERGRMLTLLNILYINSIKNSPLSTYKIQAQMEAKGVVCVNSQFSEAVSTLRDLGFKIQKDGSNYYLAQNDYSDSELMVLLKCVSSSYYRVDKESDYRLSVLLLERLGVNRRITRNNLIALHLSHYISTLEEDEIDTFPKVFRDYADSINMYLDDARYQRLSEKNIFDMYVVTALYFYLVENNGYM